MSPLQEGYITAEAQRSQRKFYCLAQTFASLRIELRCVFGVLWALSVSAVRFCSEVMYVLEQWLNFRLLEGIMFPGGSARRG